MHVEMFLRISLAHAAQKAYVASMFSVKFPYIALTSLLTWGIVPFSHAAEISSAPPLSQKPKVEKIGQTRFRMGTMEFDQMERALYIPAVINMNTGPLEYLLVHESGKVHESLLSTKATPFDFNVALLLLDYKISDTFFDTMDKDAGPRPRADAIHRKKSQLDVFARWKNAEGVETTQRIETWLHNLEKRAHITDGPFIFTGSMILPDGQYAAQQSGSLIALWADHSAVVNNPREGNEFDDLWIPDPAVPAKGTAITLILRAPKI